VNCIAHRGFAGRHPENTLAAVRAAVEQGADGIEVDVRRCGSGELVVVHDETVDRVTDATGVVGTLSRAELAALSVLGTGEGVPTLAAVCRAVPPSVELVLELKEPVATDAAAVAGRHECSVTLSSLSADRLREVAGDRGPSVPLALVFYEDPGRALDVATDLDCAAVHPHWRLCEDSLVTSAHERALGVCAWTAESAETARRLADAGVDGVMVNSPGDCPETCY
jgi:glycerophosphoryl diester phosphodiesterase